MYTIMSNKNDKLGTLYKIGVVFILLWSVQGNAAAFDLTIDAAPEIEAFILSETNRARENVGLAPLQRHPSLSAIANDKATQLATRSEFAHRLSDGSMVWSLFPKYDYRYRHAGENLALHFRDGQALMAAWLNSPSHRANVLASKYTEMGVGVAVGNFGGHRSLVIVHIFASPLE